MKKKGTCSDIINQYKSSCNIMYKATLDGKYKVNNKEGTKMIKLFKYLEQNIELAKEVLPLLFNDENVVTRTEAAGHCLALKINIKEAERILNDESNNEKNGIFGFNAQMTLKLWKEEGELKLY